MSDRRVANPFWQSVALRLIVVWLLGWATVLWFRGCLVPATREELHDIHQKSVPPEPPAR